jgi:serine/threonine-protein kinase
MKKSYLPALVFGIIYLCFLAFVFGSAGQLPPRVATHFNFAGQPDGWMTRTSYLVFLAISGSLSSMFLIGLFFSMRFFPKGAFNLSRRDYWLAPERRAETFAYLYGQAFWLASMTIVFLAGLHGLTIQANRQGALVHLSTPMAFAVAGCFVVGVIVWVICLYRHFEK